MKSRLRFDPHQYDYGPATEAIRQILLDWESIDWFAPARTRPDEAKELFRKHNELGHAFAPTLFSRSVDVSHRAGGWSEFMAWCARVRSQPLGSVADNQSLSWKTDEWDWKYSILKPLSAMHAKAHGWNLDEQIAHDGEPRPGDLFVRRRMNRNGVEGSFVVWNTIELPIAELKSRWQDPAGGAANFYHSYADFDITYCIQWQLAERSNNLADNPFVPLLACYRAGFYPFSLSSDSVVLFEFTTAKLPELDSE